MGKLKNFLRKAIKRKKTKQDDKCNGNWNEDVKKGEASTAQSVALSEEFQCTSSTVPSQTLNTPNTVLLAVNTAVPLASGDEVLVSIPSHSSEPAVATVIPLSEEDLANIVRSDRRTAKVFTPSVLNAMATTKKSEDVESAESAESSSPPNVIDAVSSDIEKSIQFAADLSLTVPLNPNVEIQIMDLQQSRASEAVLERQENTGSIVEAVEQSAIVEVEEQEGNLSVVEDVNIDNIRQHLKESLPVPVVDVQRVLKVDTEDLINTTKVNMDFGTVPKKAKTSQIVYPIVEVFPKPKTPEKTSSSWSVTSEHTECQKIDNMDLGFSVRRRRKLYLRAVRQSQSKTVGKQRDKDTNDALKPKPDVPIPIRGEVTSIVRDPQKQVGSTTSIVKEQRHESNDRKPTKRIIERKDHRGDNALGTVRAETSSSEVSRAAVVPPWWPTEWNSLNLHRAKEIRTHFSPPRSDTWSSKPAEQIQKAAKSMKSTSNQEGTVVAARSDAATDDDPLDVISSKGWQDLVNEAASIHDQGVGIVQQQIIGERTAKTEITNTTGTLEPMDQVIDRLLGRIEMKLKEQVA